MQNFPVFGSSPDLVAQQIYNWSAADRAVQSDNIARANAAENNLNNYFGKVADMRRANTGIENQFVFDERNRTERAAINAVTRTEEKSRFDTQMKFQEKELAARIKDAADRVKSAQQEEADKIKAAADKLKAKADEQEQSVIEQQLSGSNAALFTRIDSGKLVDEAALVGIMDAVANATKASWHPTIRYNPGSKRFEKSKHVPIGRPPADTYDFTSATGTTPPPQAAPVVAPSPGYSFGGDPVVARPVPVQFGRGGATVTDFSNAASPLAIVGRFTSKEAVVAAYKAGQISRAEAAKALIEQFGVPMR